MFVYALKIFDIAFSNISHFNKIWLARWIVNLLHAAAGTLPGTTYVTVDNTVFSNNNIVIIKSVRLRKHYTVSEMPAMISS